MGFTDLTDQKFGSLTVLKRVKNNKRNRAMWYCRCDCGHENCLGENIVPTTDLKNGKVKGCGHHKKVKDLSGKKFRRLEVISRAENKNGRVYWNCLCECGTKKQVMGKHLRSGAIVSCGCFSKELGGHNFRDLMGQKFGRWEVIERVENDIRGVSQWLCRCTCESKTESVIKGSTLTTGHSKSCGCFKREKTSEFFLIDLKGHKFGRLTVIERFGQSKNGEPLWLCNCECGENSIVLGSSLRGGHTKSCGCWQKEQVSGEKSVRWIGGKDFVFFDTYAPRLEKFEKVRRNPKDKTELQVRCTFCNKWFSPNRNQINSRLSALNNIGQECNLYCSDNCKSSCPVYRQKTFRKGENPNIDRPDQRDWAEMVKLCADYRCEICGKIETELIAHHIEGILHNPVESADVVNGIALCKECDKKVHSEKGCRPVDLQCK